MTLALIFGAAIGVLLGLLGGGGSILAVPALVYAIGLDLRQAIPISLIVVGVAAAFGAALKVRANHVQWPVGRDLRRDRHPATFVGSAIGSCPMRRS
jgi:uncharacterized membrane protein YfcA